MAGSIVEISFDNSTLQQLEPATIIKEVEGEAPMSDDQNIEILQKEVRRIRKNLDCLMVIAMAGGTASAAALGYAMAPGDSLSVTRAIPLAVFWGIVYKTAKYLTSE